MNFFKIKFGATKDNIKKGKRQLTYGRKYFQIIYKQYIQNAYKLNNENINYPSEKWVRDFNTQFSTEDIKVAYKHMKRRSTSFESLENFESKTK